MFSAQLTGINIKKERYRQMKKTYITPTAEKIEFDYSKQVVASGESCRKVPVATNVNQRRDDFNCVTGITWTK